MIILKGTGLKKYYGTDASQIKAVDGIDINFEEGEFTAIVGRSGTGKTTLINILSGLCVPDEGSVYLEDCNLNQLNNRKRTIIRRRRIGLVFQKNNLLSDLTIHENILLPLKLDNRKDLDYEYIKTLIDGIGITDLLSKYPDQLSGGQCQKAAMVRALINKPAVLFADEPTGNLDRISGMELLETLHQIKRKLNQTLIMVTHDQLIADGAERVITLSDGQIIADTKAKSNRME